MWHQVALRGIKHTREGRVSYPHMEAAGWARERFQAGDWHIHEFGSFIFRSASAALEFKMRWG